MRRLALLVSVVCAVLAPPAGGAVIATDDVAVGPILDGSGVTWGAEPAGALVVRSWQDGVVRDRVRLPAPRHRPTQRRFSVTDRVLAASPSWLAFIGVRSPGPRPPYTFSLWSGPATGPLSPRSGLREVAAVDADGDALAWAEQVGAPDGPRRYDVAVAANGTVRRWVAAHGKDFVGDVAVAGRHVAWTTASAARPASGRLRVADRATGRIVLRGNGNFFGVAVRPDGTVVVLEWLRTGRIDVMRASPSSPGLRRIAVQAHGDGIAIAGDRVVFSAAHDEDFSTEIALVPLSGGRRRSLVRYPFEGPQVSEFDFDGTRLAWSEYDGNGTAPHRINLVDVP